MRTVCGLTDVKVSSTGRPATSMGASCECSGERRSAPKPAVAKVVRVCLRVPGLSMPVRRVSAFCIGLDSVAVVNSNLVQAVRLVQSCAWHWCRGRREKRSQFVRFARWVRLGACAELCIEPAPRTRENEPNWKAMGLSVRLCISEACAICAWSRISGRPVDVTKRSQLGRRRLCGEW